jgi:hypothetical protein
LTASSRFEWDFSRWPLAKDCVSPGIDAVGWLNRMTACAFRRRLDFPRRNRNTSSGV